jgi:hypothetical protein
VAANIHRYGESVCESVCESIVNCTMLCCAGLYPAWVARYQEALGVRGVPLPFAGLSVSDWTEKSHIRPPGWRLSSQWSTESMRFPWRWVGVPGPSQCLKTCCLPNTSAHNIRERERHRAAAGIDWDCAHKRPLFAPNKNRSRDTGRMARPSGEQGSWCPNHRHPNIFDIASRQHG